MNLSVAGISASVASVLTLIGKWMGLISPVVAGITIILGCAIAFYSWKHRRHQNRMDELEEAKHKADFEKYGIK